MQNQENTRLFVRRIFQKIVEADMDSIESDPKVKSAEKTEKEKLAVAKTAEESSVKAKITAVEKQIADKQRSQRQIPASETEKRKESESEIRDLLRKRTELNQHKKASREASRFAKTAAANVKK